MAACRRNTFYPEAVWFLIRVSGNVLSAPVCTVSLHRLLSLIEYGTAGGTEAVLAAGLLRSSINGFNDLCRVKNNNERRAVPEGIGS